MSEPWDVQVDGNEWVQCGVDLAKLTPSCELRWWLPATPGQPKVLQQRWVARAKMPDGDIWEEERWRDVPMFLD